MLSSGLDSESLVTQLDESKDVNLVLDDKLLGLLEVELRVSQVLESFLGLLWSDVARALQVIQRVDVLQLSVIVNDGTVAIYFPLLQRFNQESLHLLRLLVSQHSG